MNKKMVSEFAVGVVLLVALVVGGIFWLRSAREIAELNAIDQRAQLSMNNVATEKPIKSSEKIESDEKNTAENACEAHYYEGEAVVGGWFVSEGEDGIVVAIKKDDVEKLPSVAAQQANEAKDNFTVKLVDPTDVIKDEIKASSEKKPATITIQGYAEICQQPPLVSIKPAMEAFKKRS